MGWRPRLLCCLLLPLSLAAVARAATRYQEWEISYQFKSPDCVRKLAVTINGQTPGPTIRATQGDTVEVSVMNSLLTENLAIHWHGIRQIGTPWADGTEGVTRCPILPGDTFTYTFVVDRPGTYMYHAHYGMQLSAGLYGLIVVAAAPGGPDAEPLTYDGEHDAPLNDWWHKSTYEQATGLAAVPMVWVGEPHSLLINGRGSFVNCSPMATGACNATLLECATLVFAAVPSKRYRFRIAGVTSLSALNFEIEDLNGAKESITVKAVASGTTSSRRPPMGYQYGAALVAVMLCLFLGEFFVALYLASGNPAADQNPAADESTIARSGPAGSASGSLPVGGGHTPSPSPPSSTDPAYRSSATSSTSGEETVLTEEDPSGPPGSPPQRPVVPPAVPLADNVEGPLLTFVLAVLGYDVAAAVGILTEFEHIVGTWSTAAEVVYGVLTVVAIALLAVGLMAAGWHARAGNSNQLSVSAFCAKLVAIIFTFLLVVAFSCKLGRWACLAAVPSAAVIACIMAAVWIWGDEHAVANAVVSTCWGRILGQRREREPAAAGDDMV